MFLIKIFATVFPFLFLIQNAQASSCSEAIQKGGLTAHPILEPLPSQYKLVATSSRGSLYFSELAERKAKAIDAMIAEREIAAEIFGVGLTRTYNERLIVEDVVVPAEDKILFIGGIFMLKEVLALVTALEHSKQLRLEVNEHGLYIKSDNSKYDIPVKPEIWGFMVTPLSRLCNCSIPEDYTVAIAQIKTQGISLRTDWEMVVFGTRVVIFDSYFARAASEAAQRGLEMKFNMHHHPRLGLLTAIMSGKPRSEQQNYLSTILNPSVNDLDFMDAMETDWFEIRIFGRIGNLDSNETTSRYFDMREIRSRKISITTLVENLFSLKPEESTKHLSSNVTELLDWVKSKNLEMVNFLEYTLGSERFKELKDQATTLIRSDLERDKLIVKLFNRS